MAFLFHFSFTVRGWDEFTASQFAKMKSFLLEICGNRNTVDELGIV